MVYSYKLKKGRITINLILSVWGCSSTQPGLLLGEYLVTLTLTRSIWGERNRTNQTQVFSPKPTSLKKKIIKAAVSGYEGQSWKPHSSTISGRIIQFSMWRTFYRSADNTVWLAVVHPLSPGLTGRWEESFTFSTCTHTPLYYWPWKIMHRCTCEQKCHLKVPCCNKSDFHFFSMLLPRGNTQSLFFGGWAFKQAEMTYVIVMRWFNKAVTAHSQP